MPAKAATTLRLSSPAFRDGDVMPERFTAAGGNTSPPIEWSDAPEGTASFVLVLERTERGTTATHWLVYDIPADRSALPEGLPHGARTAEGIPQGRNDFGNLGYDGPRPDEGHRDFRFVLHAVDKRLSGVGARMNLAEINLLLTDHVLATARLSFHTA